MSEKPKVYLAAPFFTPEQVSFVESIEKLIEDAQWEMFSPRKAENALEMNGLLKKKFAHKNLLDEQIKRGIVTQAAYKELEEFEPSAELRHKVFYDNFSNIDDADLLLAVIDNFDVGVMWEVGYAFACHVPIVTTTGNNYGCNLMLAHSIVGHTKSLDAVAEVLRIGNPALAFDRKLDEYGAAIAEIQQKYKSDFALKEGPDERNQ